MTATVVRPDVYQVPAPDPIQFNLLDVATVHDGMAWIDPIGLFDSFNCIRPVAVDWTCPPASKTLTPSPAWVDGTRFYVYVPATCKSVGYDQSEGERSVSDLFDRVESFAVEQRFQAAVLASAPAVVAGTFTPVNALALLEQDAATKYAGKPTIHMSRAIASLLTSQNVLDVVGSELRTKLGSKVAAGGGYASTSMWATGEVTVLRGDKIVQQALNQGTNEVVTMAERAYVAAGDCYKAVVGLVTIAPNVFSDEPGGDAADTGTDTIVGPGSWTPPSGTLRSVSVVVTNGSVRVDGDEITAPNTINFDADSGETLDPPVIEADTAADRAVVAWVVNP